MGRRSEAKSQVFMGPSQRGGQSSLASLAHQFDFALSALCERMKSASVVVEMAQHDFI
jgi:hypothetical protein